MTVKWNGVAVTAMVKAGVMRGIIRGAESVREEAVSRILSGQKTGRIYRRRSVEHKASAPGEAPASDTGRLANSISTSYDGLVMSGTITARTRYAAAMEFGTQTIEPRPYLRPSLNALLPFISGDIANEIRRASL